MSARIWMRLGMAVLLSGSVALAQQQTPPPAKQEKPKKAKKVWGDEDVKDLRKPADEYAEQKQADDDAAKAKKDAPPAAQKPAEKPAADDPTAGFPKTVAETVKLLDEKNEEVAFAQQTVEDLTKQVEEAASDEQKAALQKKLDAQVAAVKEAETELKLIEAHLKKLRAQPGQGTPAPPVQKPPEI